MIDLAMPTDAATASDTSKFPGANPADASTGEAAPEFGTVLERHARITPTHDDARPESTDEETETTPAVLSQQRPDSPAVVLDSTPVPPHPAGHPIDMSFPARSFPAGSSAAFVADVMDTTQWSAPTSSLPTVEPATTEVVPAAPQPGEPGDVPPVAVARAMSTVPKRAGFDATGDTSPDSVEQAIPAPNTTDRHSGGSAALGHSPNTGTRPNGSGPTTHPDGPAVEETTSAGATRAGSEPAMPGSSGHESSGYESSGHESSGYESSGHESSGSGRSGPAHVVAEQHVTPTDPIRAQSGPGGSGESAGAEGARTPTSTGAAAHAEANDLLARAELRRLTAGGSRLGIDLTTSDLGQVRVEATGRSGGMHVQLTADDSAARSVLSQHLDDLRDQLDAGGIDLESVSVDVGSRRDERAASGRHGRSDQAAQPNGDDNTGATGVNPAGTTSTDTSATQTTSGMNPLQPLDPSSGLDLRL